MPFAACLRLRTEVCSVCMQSLLRAVGVGAAKSLPTAAGINWVLKDGLGRIGRLTVATRFGQSFDADLKVATCSTQTCRAFPPMLIALAMATCLAHWSPPCPGSASPSSVPPPLSRFSTWQPLCPQTSRSPHLTFQALTAIGHPCTAALQLLHISAILSSSGAGVLDASGAQILPATG